MTTLNESNAYEFDRLEKSQSIVVKHIEDHSSGLPLVMGFLAYALLLPALFVAMILVSTF